MKTAKILIFLLAFVIGLIAVQQTIEIFNYQNPQIAEQPDAASPIQIKSESPTLTTEEKVDWQDEEPSKFKTKIIEAGGVFHGEDIEAKSGETWLGLFRRGDEYFLSPTKLKITRAHDELADGNDEKIKTGKIVAADKKGKVVFLLKNAKIPFSGKVETLFWAEDYAQAFELKNRAEKEFDFNGDKYSLRVENRKSLDEYPSAGSKLILSRNNEEQVLYYLKDGCNDCAWMLYWTGDIDHDGKLDFYLRLSDHYNINDMRLFLSSPAGRGKLVKHIATFSTSGC